MGAISVGRAVAEDYQRLLKEQEAATLDATRRAQYADRFERYTKIVNDRGLHHVDPGRGAKALALAQASVRRRRL